MIRQISSKLTYYMSDRHIFFFLIQKIGDWSLDNKPSEKQRFKVKPCSNNTTLVPENMSDEHISIL